jgi:hypothetical protein
MSESPPPSDRNEFETSTNQDRHVGVGRDVVDSTIVTGDRNVIGNQNLVVHGNYIQAPSTPRSPSEQQLLNQVKAEVASRLSQSLHSAIFINLDKESQPQQVFRVWDAEVKVGERSSEALPTDTSILQMFERSDIAGKLLILGKPGSGKTTTQLKLAKALIERSEQSLNAPTPVLFNLSSWQNEHQSIDDWIVAELKSKYGVRRGIGEKWLKEYRLLPLLDGLDELNPQRQEPCIHTLNQFIAGESAPLQVVVCSRLEEYERLGTQLRLNGAIYLKELTDDQIQAYLSSTHQQDLWKLLSQDATLLALLRAPLLLSMAVLAYQQDASRQWETLRTSQERLQFLLDAFIQSRLEQVSTSVLSQNHKGYTRQQTRRWLSWLAQQLERESQTEFLIEKMQPSWLPTQRLLVKYHRRSRLFFVLIGGLIGGLTMTRIGASIGALSMALSGELDKILVTESLDWWSWAEAKKVLRRGLISGLISGLVGGLVGGLFGRLFGKLAFGLIWGLFGGFSTGLILGLSNGLIWGLSGSEVEQKSFPNQGIWRTLQNSLLYMLVYILIFGLSIGLISGLTGGLIGGWPNGLVSGLIGGLGTALRVGIMGGLFFGVAGGPGGKAGGGLTSCIKHVFLRIILYNNGCIPWNYAQFLNHCTDRLLLQRVGGRYRFMHKLLQEHFAAMPFEKP